MYFIKLRQLNKIQEILKTYTEYAEQYNEYGVQKTEIPKENVINLLNNMVDEILKAL